MRMRDTRGFTLIELLIVIVIISIIAAFAIPGLRNMRSSANETSAIASLRAIATAQASYAASCANGGYATKLEDLAKPPTAGGSAFISPDLKSDPTIKSGYSISLGGGATDVTVTAKADVCNAPTNDAKSDFFASASPVAFGSTGSRHFAVDSRGTVFQNRADVAITAATIDTFTPAQ